MLEQVLYELRLRFVEAVERRQARSSSRIEPCSALCASPSSAPARRTACRRSAATAPSAARPIRAIAARGRRFSSSCRTTVPRRRSRGAVRSILVDTSTDLRAQALANDVRRVDAILFTHSHADHVLGLDEVRRFNQMQRTPIALLRATRTRWPICGGCSRTSSTPPRQQGGGIPQLSLFPIAGPFTLGGVEIVPVPLLHGRAADPRLPRSDRSRT